ncbi:MAG TPA: xanthine dehydrogenase family protein molybdopterin-binding subunit [Bryobacteraceae bacterium]|jgi:xanthine dehydrogenase YagR molybdenum-binding subunit|nr:xanthine dehydrogenase family protein molybdopterin-binding subunit [Bryobacteraceae bacterium]
MEDLIGEPLDRVDGPLKVSGRAPYAYEQKLPAAVYGVMAMSSIAKGRITSIDTRGAERVPGVLWVMTHLNAPRLAGEDVNKPDNQNRVIQTLQDGEIHYSNQPIAVAVAETLVAAEEAAFLIKVRYASAKPSVSLQSSMPSLYTPAQAHNNNPAITNRGNAQTGLNAGTARVQNEYYTPFETHNPMEPHATIAVWNGPESLILYDSTQGVFSDRDRVASLLGLKPENVLVISPYLGGGFGSKGPVWSHVVLAAMAARHVKRPVKLAVERPQMFGAVGVRSSTHQTIAAAASADGALTALRNDTISHTSTFDQFVESASLPTRMLYACPNNSTSQKLVRSDIGTPSFMRAPGEATGVNALEIALDELAYELKMDPIALRLKNYAEKDPETNLPWSSKSLRECYRMGADKFGWEKRPKEPRSVRDGNMLAGWGMATAEYPTRRSASTAKAIMHADGKLEVDAGTQDLGTGTYTVMTQVAAQTMGLPVSRVRFRLGDTRYPNTPVSGGSQTAASTGSAVQFATSALREKLAGMAIADKQSPLSGATMGDIAFENGRIFIKSSPSRGETLQALLARHQLPSVETTATSQPGLEKKAFSMYAFGAQFAEVRVDADLGEVHVSRMLGVFAAGRILNAKTARSQLIGGMVWGASMALFEQNLYDERLGRIVNNNLAEYHVPANLDIPHIEALWVDEVDHRVNPLGVKGIGEIGITGAAAAIANAIFHATGKRVRDLPITPDKLIV